jgi:hypothetical protein
LLPDETEDNDVSMLRERPHSGGHVRYVKIKRKKKRPLQFIYKTFWWDGAAAPPKFPAEKWIHAPGPKIEWAAQQRLSQRNPEQAGRALRARPWSLDILWPIQSPISSKPGTGIAGVDGRKNSREYSWTSFSTKDEKTDGAEK